MDQKIEVAAGGEQARGRSQKAWAPWLASVIGFSATLYLFFPGFMEWDATWQLQQAASGEIDNSHPPIMVYLWKLTNQVSFGPSGMLVVQAGGYWAGLALIASNLAQGAVGRGLLVLGLGFFPPVFGVLATISKDSGSMSALMATSGLTLQARASGRKGPAMAALPFAFYALAVRFNNLLTVLPLLWLLADSLLASRRVGRIGAFAALGVAMISGAAVVNTVGVKRTAYFTAVPLWDLSQISLMRNELLVPRSAITRADLDLKRLRWISRTYRCDYRRVRVDGRLTQDIDHAHLTTRESWEILGTWLAAIVDHPREYLVHRGRIMRAVLFAPDPVFVHVFEPIEGYTFSLEFSPRPGYAPLKSLLDACEGSLPCLPWVYLLLATLVFGFSWRARDERTRVARAIAASGLLSVVPLAVLAPAIDYRYSVWLVAAAVVSATLAWAPGRLVSFNSPRPGAKFISRPGPEGSGDREFPA